MSSIGRAVRSAGRAVGIDLRSYSKTEWKWGNDVHAYYPVKPTPRWGYGKAPHAKLTAILERERASYELLIDTFSRYKEIYASVPLRGDAVDENPFWQNEWFYSLDAMSLMGMLASARPKRYFEIGCGNSTKFARFTIKRERLATTITSLDPNPRASIDTLCDVVIRKPLEDCDLALFDQLEKGDILFFDGSHRTFTNSDVTVFFLELLPRLKPGVIVHIHDIFLPWDYWPVWEKRLYSEQYMLAAMLLCPKPLFEVILPNWFICHDPELLDRAKTLFGPINVKVEGFSFWLKTV